MQNTNLSRMGWSSACPNCKNEFRYTTLNSWGADWIVFYHKNDSSMILTDRMEGLEEIDGYLREIEFENLFPSKSFRIQDFSVSNNAKCPECNFEFENENPQKVIWIEGNYLFDLKTEICSFLENIQLQ